MKEIIFLLAREWQQVRHDLRRLVFLFGAAAAYLIIFGMLYQPNIITAVPTVIYDEDQSALSRQLVRDFESSDRYEIIAYASSQAEMKELLRQKKALTAIDIPEDFSQKAKTGSYSTVLYLANGSNIILTNITSAGAQDILADFSNHLAAKQAALRYGADEQKLLKRLAPVSVHLRVLYNTTQGYLYFFLLGLAMVAYQQGILFATGASACYETEHPEENKGIAAWKLLLSKTAFYWFFSMLSYFLVIAIVVYLWQIPLKAPLGELLSLAALFILAVTFFSFTAASFFRNELSFVRTIILYPVPAFILSGYIWPTPAMASWVQVLAQFFPLSYLSSTVRELFLIGTSPHYLASIQHLLFLLVLFFLSAVCLYGRRLQKMRRQAAEHPNPIAP